MASMTIIEKVEQLAARLALLPPRYSMAAACRKAGLHETTPSRWKRGLVVPSMENYDRLEAAVEEFEREHAQSTAA